ncbi:MAG TPA: FAD-binding protein, partial [Micromonosporaceae bacterium]|nr:FAD-binding protein [Micromonosporaceae bacterium]
FQGYYGGTSEPAGWAMIGFQPDVAVGGLDPDPLTGIELSQLKPDYDVVIVGAGAGGGVAAAELSGRGLRVLLVERSRPMRDTDFEEITCRASEWSSTTRRQVLVQGAPGCSSTPTAAPNSCPVKPMEPSTAWLL